MAWKQSTARYIVRDNILPVNFYNSAKDEVIVVNYEFGKLTKDEIVRVFDALHKAFPENTVILIPDDISLKMLNKSQLLDVRDNLSKMIDELSNDNKS